MAIWKEKQRLYKKKLRKYKSLGDNDFVAIVGTYHDLADELNQFSSTDILRIRAKYLSACFHLGEYDLVLTQIDDDILHALNTNEETSDDWKKTYAVFLKLKALCLFNVKREGKAIKLMTEYCRLSPDTPSVGRMFIHMLKSRNGRLLKTTKWLSLCFIILVTTYQFFERDPLFFWIGLLGSLAIWLLPEAGTYVHARHEMYKLLRKK